ncbi:MAG: enoyl-CoA hydratase/isomerase family protein [bacterium]|nr:enoyl-CoA hydratase/isomerase family protein [bacterium]
MSQTTTDTIQATLTDGILHLKLNINENNSMTPEGFAALDAALENHAKDPAVRVVVLGSAVPGFFCNGLNPNAVHGASEDQIKDLIQYFFSVLKKLLFFPVPVVAAINGHAMGYGAMLALMSDFRLMLDKGARISFPEINIGIGLPVFVSRPLQDLVGMNNARDMLLYGKALKGPDAQAMGLVDDLVDAEGLEAAALKVAKKLSGLSNSAVKSMMNALHQRYTENLEAILAEDTANTIALLQSPDAKEGFSAMVEKRRPKFS